MFEQDNDIVKHALRMWKNYIETGNVTLSTEDLRNMGSPTRSLTQEQVDFTTRLELMAQKNWTTVPHRVEHWID